MSQKSLRVMIVLFVVAFVGGLIYSAVNDPSYNPNYLDRVEIVSGFFQGQTGVVKKKNRTDYLIKLDNYHWVNVARRNLVKIDLTSE